MFLVMVGGSGLVNAEGACTSGCYILLLKAIGRTLPRLEVLVPICEMGASIHLPTRIARIKWNPVTF